MSVSLTHTAITMIDSAGYGGLAAGLVLDSAGIPIPSEVLVPLSVASAKTGNFSLPLVLLVAVAAQVVGGVIAYEIGRRGGLPLLERYGKYVLISQHDLRRAHAQFVRNGEWYAGAGRCVPFVRGYIGFAAGIAAMPFGRFLLATFIGSAVWTGLLAVAGVVLADNLEQFDRVMSGASVAVLLVLAATVVWWVARHKRMAS